jgi:chromosome partitioning protein
MFYVEHEGRMMMRKAKVFSVINQKGGVGKTTTAVNLASAFAAVDMRVLLIDLDPQGNATTGVGVYDIGLTVYEALLQLQSMQDVVSPTFLPCLFVAGADNRLAGAEIELVPLWEREKKLLLLVEQVRHAYDYIFIDCPPSLGLLTLNALVASDEVIIPVQCEFYALEGLSRLLTTIKKIQEQFNQTLKISGILLTMYDGRCLLNQQVADDVRRILKDKVFETIIPRNVKTAEASSHGKPVIFYDRRSVGALRYLELAKYILDRERPEVLRAG